MARTCSVCACRSVIWSWNSNFDRNVLKTFLFYSTRRSLSYDLIEERGLKNRAQTRECHMQFKCMDLYVLTLEAIALKAVK